MENTRMFLRCNLCGNIVGMIQDSGVVPVCCGEEMNLLTANTSDGAVEKHVPVVKRSGSEISVAIGAVPHPMTEAHHIAWIALAVNNQTHRITLALTDKPEAVFCVPQEDKVTVYAYCNLHGLWAAEG